MCLGVDLKYLFSAEEPNSALRRKQIRYAAVVATAGSEPSVQHGWIWPLALNDIASSKRRTEHRMGLRPLRRDAAAMNTPKRMTLTPFLRVRCRVTEQEDFSGTVSTLAPQAVSSTCPPLLFFAATFLLG